MKALVAHTSSGFDFMRNVRDTHRKSASKSLLKLVAATSEPNCHITKSCGRTLYVLPFITKVAIYHINGQQTVTLHGNTATGVCYCQVVMIAESNGKRTFRQQGVRYTDEYQKINGRWYIKNRVSNFMWVDTKDISK